MVETPDTLIGPAPGIESILECIPHGIVVANREGKVLLSNGTARRILGPGLMEVPAGAWTEAFGLYLSDEATPFPHDQLPLVRAIRGETVFDTEIVVRNSIAPAGTSLIVSGTPWKDETGALRGGIATLRQVMAGRSSRDPFERLSIEDRDVEMRLAGLVQKRLYPPILRREGLDVAGAAHPANATGGDYYDYLTMPEGRLGIVVADVSGHGLGSALIMVATRAALRSCVQTQADLDEVLDHVNATLLGDLHPHGFVTMFLASLDTRARCLTYSSAGHPPGYVLDRAGEIKFIMESTRIPLGIMADWKGLAPRTHPLERGDILVFLTDGIIESVGADGEPFGVDNALALVKEHRLEPAQRILGHLMKAVHTCRKGVPQEDDMTAVICKVDDLP